MTALEKMDAFFEARLAGYDEHMMTGIEGAREFYPFTASLLPQKRNAAVLDLGCGTGLELQAYFALNDSAKVTAVDLSAAMLTALKGKFHDKDISIVRGSYFDVPFGESVFDAAVSVESLHHFKAERKTALYRKVYAALKPDGVFVLTDYFAESEELEKEYSDTLERLKREQGISDDAFYHYDTPLTVDHETQTLETAGFSNISVMKNWGATYTLMIRK